MILIIIKLVKVLLGFSPKIINTLRSYIKNSKECFIRYPNTSKLVKKNSAAPRFFNQLLSVWISDETLLHVFDIFHQLRAFWVSPFDTLTSRPGRSIMLIKKARKNYHRPLRKIP